MDGPFSYQWIGDSRNKVWLKLFLVLAAAISLLGGDLLRFEQIEQMLVEELHSFSSSRLDNGGDLESLRFPDQVGDGGRSDHDLQCHYPSIAVGTLQELLADHPLERLGEHGSYLRLLILGKDVDDPVNGFRSAAGVEGAENQVTGFGRTDGECDGFQVPHLSHENHIGILPERRTERR